MNKRFSLALGATMLAAAPALAADHGTGHKMTMPGAMADKMPGQAITVAHPWARASIGKNGAAFLTVTNNGKTDDRLVGVTAGVAGRAELHTHRMDGDIMRMRRIEAIDLPAGASVTLKPGGHHVMLMGLTGRLNEGGTFPLTLIFEKAGKMPVTVTIGKMGAAGPMDGMKGGHGGHQMKH